MGLCASMLQRRTERRYPEPRRGTAKALFVVRGDRRPSNPEGLVVRVQDSGRTQLRRPGREESGGRGGCWQQGTGALDWMIARARMPRLPCAGTGTVGVEPDAPLRTRETTTAAGRGAPPGLGVEPDAPLYTRKMTAADGGAPPGPRWTPPTAPVTPTPAMTAMGGAPAAPSTPASAATTPGRPVWQRRILMGMRCELPRFSGLVLYDEHGRPIQVGTPGRRNHRQGKKKTARTSSTTTLRDLL